ncbi:NYN domain-containing protein [Pseudonocardia alaniniphila]|uniref:NYN domain-containing protein n=1 Tax=Pseudonocardia alaniniphila TaxID=75291 RepID=A0ABS9T978_9PSEU|nr:NYN domain-containing protein [Pseudonocardia alaniniphila]MCH6164856.1 NYN domain-containing protein [Pseudonocardia alaniniphila]
MGDGIATLRAAVVVDYQNVHLTGHELFQASRHLQRHESLIDPWMFAGQLISARNRAQRPGMDLAELSAVLVYRGEPSPEHDPKAYARNQAQKAHWEREKCVTVQLRPLKYRYQRDAGGNLMYDANGKRVVESKSEKGVDVLCALAMVREARRPDVDLVILASHDSDLEPALDEAIALQSAKVETFSWFDPAQPRRMRQLRPGGARRVWNTRLGETEFVNCWDRSDYT